MFYVFVWGWVYEDRWLNTKSPKPPLMSMQETSMCVLSQDFVQPGPTSGSSRLDSERRGSRRAELGANDWRIEGAQSIHSLG